MNPGTRLEWPGKRPPEPASTVKRFEQIAVWGGSGESTATGRLIHGDNLDAMCAIAVARSERFNLVYIDPPFFSGREWRMQTPAGTSEGGSAYSDTWNNDLGAYLQWLLDRLAAARSILAEDGSIYIHLNWCASHYARLLMDEVFGEDRFQNEIVWCYREAINSRKRWNRKHDSILFYSRSDTFKFNCDAVREAYSDTTLKKFRRQDDKGPYRIMGRGITGSPLRSRRDLAPQMEIDYPELTYRHYLGDGTLPVDYWSIDIENQASKARTGYPTQKPEALLERILLASSDEGDLVGDFCCGSGTTAAVAARLGRRWIACDSSSAAIDTTRKRLTAAGCSFIEEKIV